MSGKAKPQKHKAKEIAQKHHEAKMKAGGRGGGEEGKEKRKAPKEGKKNVFIACKICFTEQPSLKSMQIHYENKHPKEDWEGIKESYQAQIDLAKDFPFESLLKLNLIDLFFHFLNLRKSLIDFVFH